MATAIHEIATLSQSLRATLSTRAKTRAQSLFSMSSMSAFLENAPILSAQSPHLLLREENWTMLRVDVRLLRRHHVVCRGHVRYL